MNSSSPRYLQGGRAVCPPSLSLSFLACETGSSYCLHRATIQDYMGYCTGAGPWCLSETHLWIRWRLQGEGCKVPGSGGKEEAEQLVPRGSCTGSAERAVPGCSARKSVRRAGLRRPCRFRGSGLCWPSFSSFSVLLCDRGARPPRTFLSQRTRCWAWPVEGAGGQAAFRGSERRLLLAAGLAASSGLFPGLRLSCQRCVGEPASALGRSRPAGGLLPAVV